MPAYLSPAYALALIHLAHRDGDDSDPVAAWPGLLLFSRSRSWVFDSRAAVFADTRAEMNAHASAVGLHPVTDPFRDDLPAPARPWRFQLPALDRCARLFAPDLTLEITRPLELTDEWWQLVVSRRLQSRLLIAAGITTPDDPGDMAAVLRAAAAAGQVVGATIGVEI